MCQSVNLQGFLLKDCCKSGLCMQILLNLIYRDLTSLFRPTLRQSKQDKSAPQ